MGGESEKLNFKIYFPLNTHGNYVGPQETAPSTPDSGGSEPLSEMSITLLWMQQGKASNCFPVFWQAL